MSGIDSKTISLLHFDDDYNIDEMNSIYDSYQSSKNTIQTTIKKFGNGAFYNSDGASGTYIIPKKNIVDLFSKISDWTIEYWEYRTNRNTNSYGINWSSMGFNLGYDAGKSTMSCYLSSNGTSWDIASAAYFGEWLLNQWVHYAIVRNGTNINIYQNGVLKNTINIGTKVLRNESANIVILAGGFVGYIDELRISDIARYTTNFPVQTEQFIKDDNTVILSHFDSLLNIKDEISQNVWKSNGLPQTLDTIYKFNKSLYLNGGSYLNLNTDERFNFGTNDFTIDCWINCGNQNTFGTILSSGYTTWANGSQSIALYTSNAGYENKVVFNISEWWAANGSNKPMLCSSTLINTKTWIHVAIVRKGNNFYMFINGNLESQNTYNGVVNLNYYNKILIGTNLQSTAPTLIGYLDELRISKCARWISNFTPPTLQYSKIRFLAKTKDSHYHAFLNSSWSDLGTAANNDSLKNMFLNNEVIDCYDKTTIDKLTTTELPKICSYQENISEPLLTGKITAIPYRKFVSEKNDIDLKIASYIDWAKANVGTVNYQSGSGVIKFVVSRDSGKTWSTYNTVTSAWEKVFDTSDTSAGSLNTNNIYVPNETTMDLIRDKGLTIDQLAASPINDFTVANGYKTLRFGIYLEISSSTDIALVDNIQFQFDGQGTWRLAANYTHYTVDTGNNSHTLTWLTAIDAKRVKVNY